MLRIHTSDTLNKPILLHQLQITTRDKNSFAEDLWPVKDSGNCRNDATVHLRKIVQIEHTEKNQQLVSQPALNAVFRNMS